MPVSCIHQVKNTSLCKLILKFNPKSEHKKLKFRVYYVTRHYPSQGCNHFEEDSRYKRIYFLLSTFESRYFSVYLTTSCFWIKFVLRHLKINLSSQVLIFDLPLSSFFSPFFKSSSTFFLTQAPTCLMNCKH